jgi:hypothetical protein
MLSSSFHLCTSMLYRGLWGGWNTVVGCHRKFDCIYTPKTLISALRPSKRTDPTSLVYAGIWSCVNVAFGKINAYVQIRTAFSYVCRLQVGLTGLNLFVYQPFIINHNLYTFPKHLFVIDQYSWPTSDASNVTFVLSLLLNTTDIADRCIDQLVKSIPPRVELLSIDRLTTNILAPWNVVRARFCAVTRSRAISKCDMRSKAIPP